MEALDWCKAMRDTKAKVFIPFIMVNESPVCRIVVMIGKKRVYNVRSNSEPATCMFDTYCTDVPYLFNKITATRKE